MFLNFNIDYSNYTYYSNFHNFFTTDLNKGNIYLKQFMESKSFKEKTKNIFDLLTIKESPNEKEVKIVNARLEKLMQLDYNSNIENFANKLLLHYVNNGLELWKWLEDQKNYINIDTLNLLDTISSLHFSPDKKTIYACMRYQKTISIINYDSTNNKLKLSNDSISINSGGYFKKCIHIKNNCLISLDDYEINLWEKIYLNTNTYNNTKKLRLSDKLYDICKINDDSLLCSEYSKITFINIPNIIIDKVINNMHCIDEINSLLVINDNILVNCEKGISILSTVTKEITQFIEWNENKLIKTFKDKIYIYEPSSYLYEFSVIDNNFNLLSKIKFENKQYMDNSNKYYEGYNYMFRYNSRYMGGMVNNYKENYDNIKTIVINNEGVFILKQTSLDICTY